MLRTGIAVLDEILHEHEGAIGGDFAACRNHAYRVVHLCAALAPGGLSQIDKIAVAAGFHDLGIWTARTFDYLPPSIALARDYLERAGRVDWTDEVVEMISQHHKITPWRGRSDWLVEPFRRADWADVTRGAVAAGVPRGLMRTLYQQWPGAGFHRMLLRLEWQRLRTHPLNPLPMVKL
jgi:hypothetical protein